MLPEEIVNRIDREFAFLGKELLTEIASHGDFVTVPRKTQIIKTGQYIRMVPLLLEGLVKVIFDDREKELLLYYIQPGETCIMTFAAGLKNEPSMVSALTEEDSGVILLPVTEVNSWIKKYPPLNVLLFDQYNLRYLDFMEMINGLLFDKLDKRIMDFLKGKSKIKKTKTIQITHRQIAMEMGTAREVVSRLIKKLEKEKQIRQTAAGIELLG